MDNQKVPRLEQRNVKKYHPLPLHRKRAIEELQWEGFEKTTDPKPNCFFAVVVSGELAYPYCVSHAASHSKHARQSSRHTANSLSPRRRSSPSSATARKRTARAAMCSLNCTANAASKVGTTGSASSSGSASPLPTSWSFSLATTCAGMYRSGCKTPNIGLPFA
jgi:hypothetical protein